MKGKVLMSLLLGAAAGMDVAAQERELADGPLVEVGIGAEHTDNAYLNDAFKRSEMKQYAELGLGYRRAGTALVADVLYEGEFANYEHDTTDDDTVVQGRAALTWHMLPGRLQWDLSHDRSEQLQDARSPDIRNNRQLRDIITTGPTFTARMGEVDNLVLRGQYFDVSYDDSDRPTSGAGESDNQRMLGGVAWQHLRSSTDTLSLNYEHIESEFDDSSEDFTFERLFGTYAVRLASGGYSISLGANRSERQGGSDSDGFLAQIAWNLATSGHRFDLTAINELTDSGIGLGGNSLVGDDFSPSDNNFDVIDMVERSHLEFGYGYDRLCERCTVDFSLYADRQDYDTEPRDQEEMGLRGSFGYRVTPTVTASLRAGYSEIDFTNDPSGDRIDERTEYALLLDWIVSRPLTATLWVNRDERDSDVGGNDYEELAGGVSMRYRFR